MEMVGELKGNMRDVYLDVARDAEERVRVYDEKNGPYRAEIVPNCIPLWYLLRTQPGHEGIAAGHLVARGFGVYLPEVDKKEGKASDAKIKRERVFPSYLLLWCWNIDHHAKRVLACTGVSSIMTLGTPIGERYAYLPDKDVRDILAREFISVAKANFRIGRGRRKRNQIGDSNLVMVATTKSYWTNIEDLEPDARIGLLHARLKPDVAGPALGNG